MRGPDVSSRASRQGDRAVTGFVEGAPDLAVEVRSPWDRPRAVNEKIANYLATGARLVWWIDPEARAVTVHRPSQPPITLEASAQIDGGDVLPGFSCEVRELLPEP